MNINIEILIIILLIAYITFIVYNIIITKNKHNKTIDKNFNNNNNNEGFANYDNFQKTVYEVAIENMFSNNPELIKNMFGFKLNANTYPKFPVNMIMDIDAKIIAVFNDGNIYMRNNLNDVYWAGPLKNSKPNDIIPLRSINIDSNGYLYGVGYDNSLYRKKETDYMSKWYKVPNCDNIIYFCYSQYDGDDVQNGDDTEKDKVISINIAGIIGIKDFSKLESDAFKYLTNEPVPIIKFLFSKSNFLIGVGANDLRLYQKNTVDYSISRFETENKGAAIVLDIIYNYDGLIYGLVPNRMGNALEVQKQKTDYFKDVFEPMENTEPVIVISLRDIIKSKSGVDISKPKMGEYLLGDTNKEDAKQKLNFEKNLTIRKYCNEKKNNTADISYIDFVNRMNDHQEKINELENVINNYKNFKGGAILQE